MPIEHGIVPAMGTGVRAGCATEESGAKLGSSLGYTPKLSDSESRLYRGWGDIFCHSPPAPGAIES